jgi:acetyltransferase-like isoleucine patch superfamily enzyme
MRTFLRILIILPVSFVSEFYYRLYHTIILKLRHIQFDSMPIIKGKLTIYNDGVCKLGSGVRFNSALKSNLVGLYKPCTISVKNNASLTIGDYAGFSGVSIYCANTITIGKYVNCGGNVCIWDTDFHPLDFQDRRLDDPEKVKTMPIFIGDDAFIGANSIVLKGAHIGNRSIIGAGSVVTKTIPDDEIWAGNPIKFIRKVII